MKTNEKLGFKILNKLPHSTLPSLHRIWSKLSRAFEKKSLHRGPATQRLLALHFHDEVEK
jgi:hypothetical protein